MKNRLSRVQEVLKRELGILFVKHFNFSALVTVCSVNITPDLKQAHVYISVLGTQHQSYKVLHTLEQHRVELQHELAQRVILKNTPHLYFKIDASLERGGRVLAMMDALGLTDVALEDEDEEREEGEDIDTVDHHLSHPSIHSAHQSPQQ